MRIFAILLIAVAFVAIMIQRDAKNTDQPQKKPAAVLASAKPAGSPSAHNWPKNALDRANDVKRQVVAQRQSNGAN
jgi:hypothetical protein